MYFEQTIAFICGVFLTIFVLIFTFSLGNLSVKAKNECPTADEVLNNYLCDNYGYGYGLYKNGCGSNKK